MYLSKARCANRAFDSSRLSAPRAETSGGQSLSSEGSVQNDSFPGGFSGGVRANEKVFQHRVSPGNFPRGGQST